MSDIIIRNGNLKDVDALVEVDRSAFPDDWPADLVLTREQFEGCITTFPEGFSVALLDGKIVGYVAITIIELDLEGEIPSWYKLTDNGRIVKTHNPDGNVITGVSLCVDRRVQNRGIGIQLVAQIATRFNDHPNIESGIIGSRISGFRDSGKSIEAYFQGIKDGDIEDPVVSFYMRVGFRPIKAVKNFLHDPESNDWAVIMQVTREYLKEIGIL